MSSLELDGSGEESRPCRKFLSRWVLFGEGDEFGMSIYRKHSSPLVLEYAVGRVFIQVPSQSQGGGRRGVEAPKTRPKTRTRVTGRARSWHHVACVLIL